MHWERMSAGFVAIASAAWVGGADWHSGIPYGASIALLGSFLTWLGLEVFSSQNTETSANTHNSRDETKMLSPHDHSLGVKLRDLFSSETRAFLRDHDFGIPFRGKDVSVVEEIADRWKGVEYEFDNQSLKDISSALTSKCREMAEKIGMYSGVAANYPENTYSVPTDRERGSDIFDDHTRRHVAELNTLATELLHTYEDFERQFRQLAPDAFGIQ